MPNLVCPLSLAPCSVLINGVPPLLLQQKCSLACRRHEFLSLSLSLSLSHSLSLSLSLTHFLSLSLSLSLFIFAFKVPGSAKLHLNFGFP